MKSPTQFIVAPFGGQYVNTKMVGEYELIINSSIEEAKDVNRIGVILEVPIMYEGIAQEGDLCVLHHNIFRTTYSDKGVPLESNHFIEEGKYEVPVELCYMVIRDGNPIALEDNVFICPIEIDDKWLGKIEERHTGIVRYGNPLLKKSGVKEDNKVMFKKNAEYEFNIKGERLYLMKNSRILAICQEN